MSNLLTMQGICKSFGVVQALDQVDLELRAGEVLALMGENGAGKSTLMNILSGSITHYKGDFYIDGQKANITSPLDARSMHVAKIHQELQLVREMSVAENIFMGREITNKFGLVNKKAQEEEAARYLEMLEADIKPSRLISSLRVVEQQMLEIVKAISLSARILIMDEPTSALSKAEAERLFVVIRRLASHGVGIIYITHRMEEVFEISDRITVLRDGRLVGTIKTAETTEEQLISMMVGRKVEDIYPKRRHEIGEELLRVENLSVTFPQGSFKRSLKDISFTLRKGEVLGIGGLLGSGRTELLETIFGVHAGSMKGDIYLNGERLKLHSPRAAIEKGISYATEDRKGKGLVPLRSIGENMSLPKLKAYSPAGLMRTGQEARDWQAQMDGLSIRAPGTYTLAQSLSGGNQQKVVLGRWLMMEPKVLLLDEPTRGIDVGAKAEIYALINNLASKGISILLVSSDLPEIMGVSDRILVLCEGRLSGQFLKGEASQEDLLKAATSTKEKAL